MPIDPYIFQRTYQPLDVNQIQQNAYANHLLQQRGQMNDLALQQERMRLADMQNQQADQQSIRNAMAQAYQPQTANVQMPSVDVGGVSIPGSTTQVQGPRTLDRQEFLNALRPDLAAREQSAMAVQDTAQQKANVDLASSIAKLNGQQLDNAIKQTNQFRQGLGAVLSADPSLRPALYESLAKQWNHPFNGYPGDDAVKQEADQALTWEQRFQQQKDQRDFAFKKEQTAVENKQKQQQFDLTKRGQDITVRGQNLTDARARELNQISRDTKLEMNKAADQNSLDSFNADMDRLSSAANELKDHPGLGGITGKTGAFPNIPGSQAANAQAKFDTLKSQIAFATLQNLRNASKTGGALGQVSDREEKMLASNIASLERSQSKEELQKSLQKIIDFTNQAKDRARQAINNKYQAAPQTKPQSDPLAIF